MRFLPRAIGLREDLNAERFKGVERFILINAGSGDFWSSQQVSSGMLLTSLTPVNP
jgi:hypothetical protein